MSRNHKGFEPKHQAFVQSSHGGSGSSQVEAVLAVRGPGGYTPGMIILTNTGGVAMTNCYLIADETARQAVLFDAPDHTVAPLLKEVVARGWDLTGLWLTHGHFDHFADHAVVRRKFPAAKVLLHALDEPKARIRTCRRGCSSSPS